MFKRLTAAFTGAFLVILIATASSPASGLNISTPRDNDANAVIPGGVGSTQEVRTEFENRGGVRLIFGHFNISRQDVATLDSTAVVGHVTSDNRVVVNGQTVATNAVTAGRQNIAGSTKVTRNGTTFYVRPPSVSFAPSSLPAFVVTKDGQFDFAIIASCGNPVKAMPVAKPPVKEKVTPVTKTVIIEKQAPPPPGQTVVKREVVTQPAPQPSPQPVVQSLPRTGPESVVGMSAALAIGTGVGHFMYRRRFC